MRRQIAMVDKLGTVLEEGWLSHAKMGAVTWEANRPDQWSFELPTGDPQLQAVIGLESEGLGIEEPFRECVLKRGRDVLSWGPVINPRMGSGQGSVQVGGADCLEYYDRRFIGFAERPNMVNASPGVDFSGWVDHISQVQLRTSESPDADTFIDTSATHPVTGETCLHIHDVSADPYKTAWLQWDVNFTAAGFDRSATLTVETYVDDAVAFSPNFQKCGPDLAIYPLSYTDIFTGFRNCSQATVDEDYPTGPFAEPQRLSVSITVPSTFSATLVVKLFAVKGDIYYSSPVMDLDNGMVFLNEPQSFIAFKLSDHITANPDSPYIFATVNPNFPFTTDPYGWDDLNIKAPSAESEEISRTRKYLFSSRTTGLAALSEFPQLDDGFEFFMVYDLDAKSRHFTTSTRKGQDRPEFPLRYGPHNRGNVKSVDWTFQGDRASNAVVETLGGGLGQPEGASVDASAYANGLVIGEVARAPEEARPNTLNHRAEYRRSQDQIPVELRLTIPASPYFEEGLRVGDRVPVAVHVADFHLVQDLMWIKRMTLTPDDDLELTLIEWPGFV